MNIFMRPKFPEYTIKTGRVILNAFRLFDEVVTVTSIWVGCADTNMKPVGKKTHKTNNFLILYKLTINLLSLTESPADNECVSMAGLCCNSLL